MSEQARPVGQRSNPESAVTWGLGIGTYLLAVGVSWIVQPWWWRLCAEGCDEGVEKTADGAVVAFFAVLVLGLVASGIWVGRTVSRDMTAQSMMILSAGVTGSLFFHFMSEVGDEDSAGLMLIFAPAVWALGLLLALAGISIGAKLTEDKYRLEQLNRLGELWKQGGLTDEEFHGWLSLYPESETQQILDDLTEFDRNRIRSGRSTGRMSK